MKMIILYSTGFVSRPIEVLVFPEFPKDHENFSSVSHGRQNNTRFCQYMSKFEIAGMLLYNNLMSQMNNK